MTQTVIVPGVGTLQFPDGMSQADMAAAIRKNFPEIHPPKPRMSPADMKAYLAAHYQEVQDKMVTDMPWYQKLAAGAGKAVVDTGRGLGQIVGLESKQDVADARERDQALMKTGAGKVGNALGYVGMAAPAAMAAPEVAGAGLGVRALAGGASGGAQGYAAPYTSQGEHIANTLVGAGLGAAIPGAGAAAGKLVRGVATPEAKQLLQAGVRLTPGQMLGGAAKRVEDGLASVPGVSSAIHRGQQRALDDFNLATVQKALAPIGVKLGKGVSAGYDAIESGRNAISDAYSNVLGQMRGKVDSKFTNGIASTLNQHLNTLPQHLSNRLVQIVDEDVMQKLGRGASVGGDTIKKVISNLGNESRTALKSQDPAYRQLGEALQEVQSNVTNMLKRNNPAHLSKELSSVDAAHARMLRVERAASVVGADEGKFTPAQLRNAVRAEDSSYKHRAFSQGNALMQNWADAAKSSLPQKVANSGTTDRLLLADLATGGALGVAHLPGTLSAAAAAHAAYSPAGQRLMQAALAPRPNPVTNFLSQLAQNRMLNAPTNALVGRAFAPQPIPAQVQGGSPAW
ncbi:hypothetical protein ABQJ54_02080 [Rhodanobacter sp. Si-c]|uniref:Lytic transglycosylase domain-containing protein n=1 Tax=Rhodanobacter lycopersici TaxID=3162487 RepID=A0ABV3QA33_9GAMM